MLKRSDEKLIYGLRRRKFREQNRLFLAEGVRVVEELATSRFDLHLAVVAPSIEDSRRGRELLEKLAARVRTERTGASDLARLAATDSPQDVLVVAAIPDGNPDAVQFGDRATMLVLDAVQDPGNFGTLVRSADAFGVAAVISLPGTVDAWNPKAVRAGAGSSFRVPILEMTTADAASWLRGRGFVIRGADTAGEPLESLPAVRRCALVVGNEGAGLSHEARAAVDTLVSVPISGRAESLNVGVAAGILLYLLTREN